MMLKGTNGAKWSKITICQPCCLITSSIASQMLLDFAASSTQSAKTYLYAYHSRNHRTILLRLKSQNFDAKLFMETVSKSSEFCFFKGNNASLVPENALL